MPTIAAQMQTSVQERAPLIRCAAARLADKCTQSAHTSASGARPPSGASTAALVRNSDVSDSAPGHASWDVDGARSQKAERDHAQLRMPAGVTRPILSQSSDSTSRLGRNTEGTDAQSRPGAGCKPARRHRTRSASESALAKASLGERDSVHHCHKRGRLSSIVSCLETILPTCI